MRAQQFLAVLVIVASPTFGGDLGKYKKAIKSGDAEAVKRLLEAGVDVNDRGKVFGSNTLEQAVYFDRFEILKLLVEAGGDVNSKNRFGVTPLHNAAIHDRLEMAQFLLEKGAELDARTNSGQTPFFLSYKSPRTAVFLLESGADYTARDGADRSFLETVLFYASMKPYGGMADAVRGAQETLERTMPLILEKERKRSAGQGSSDGPFTALLKEVLEFVHSPEGRVLIHAGQEAIAYFMDSAAEYEPPETPQVGKFSDWYHHSPLAGGQHREASVYCPNGLILQVEEHERSGKHWYQRDAGEVLLPANHETLDAFVKVECSEGSGFRDRARQ